MKDLPIAEITLRKYEQPSTLEGRDLVKKLCLSLGLLQPGDGRDVVVDIVTILLRSKRENKTISLGEIKTQVEKFRRENGLDIRGLAESNIRRQLRKLKDLLIIERINNQYRISEFEDLDKIFEDKIERFLLRGIMERVKDYLSEIKTKDF